MFKPLADPFAPLSLQQLLSSYGSVRPAFPPRYFHPREGCSLVAFRFSSGLRFPRSRTMPDYRSCLLSAGCHWISIEVTLQLVGASQTSSLSTSSTQFSTGHQRFTYVHLLIVSRDGLSPAFSILAHHQRPYSSLQQQMAVCSLRLNGGCGGPTTIIVCASWHNLCSLWFFHNEACWGWRHMPREAARKFFHSSTHGAAKLSAKSRDVMRLEYSDNL